MEKILLCNLCKEQPIALQYGYEQHCKSCGDSIYLTEMVKTTIYLNNRK